MCAASYVALGYREQQIFLKNFGGVLEPPTVGHAARRRRRGTPEFLSNFPTMAIRADVAAKQILTASPKLDDPGGSRDRKRHLVVDFKGIHGSIPGGKSPRQ